MNLQLSLLLMISEEEKKFINYWEANRDHQGKWTTQLLSGIPLGLVFALPVFIIVFTGRYWYKRADMELNTKLNPWVLIVAVFLIALFFAFFYKKYQWEKKEQQYLEFKSKE